MKKNIVKNTIMLYGLTIAKIVFPLLTLPYLTRVLTTEAYGSVAYIKTIMQYMQLTVDFGFMLSGTKDIVKAQNKNKDIGGVAGDILLARLILSIFAFVILMFMSGFIEILRLNILYTVLSYITIFISIFLFDYLFRGLEKMEVITIRFVIMRGISTFATFFMVHNDNDILWIPILDILGSLAAVIFVIRDIRKLNVKIKFISIKNAMEKLKESAIYFASDMATTAFGALNTVLIGIYLPVSDVAYWSICMQLIGGVQTLYSPITGGIYPEMIKSKDLKIIKKILKVFMPLIVLGSLFSFAIGRYALYIVGGVKYTEAVWLFRLLIPIWIISFPAMVIGWPTLGAIEKQSEVTKTTIISAVFQLSGLVFLVVFGQFTLYKIAILRCATELVLLIARTYYLEKYKFVFLAK